MPPPSIVDLAASSDVRFRDIVGRDHYQVATSGNLIQNIYHHVSGGGAANVSVMRVASMDSNNNAQMDMLMSTSTQPLSLTSITTANISTVRILSLEPTTRHDDHPVCKCGRR